QGGDAERARAAVERSTRAVDGTVAVAVRLHDGPQLRAAERVAHALRVRPQGGEIDPDLAPDHCSGGSQPSPASARWIAGKRSLATAPTLGCTSREAIPCATA